MNSDAVVALFRESIYMVLLLITVLMIPGLIVGVVVAMFQAATQINESSLSFIPKLIVTFLTLLLAGPWLLKTLVSYTDALINNIPNMIS
jgi:flagellar biosynthetic protein FliQ